MTYLPPPPDTDTLLAPVRRQIEIAQALVESAHVIQARAALRLADKTLEQMMEERDLGIVARRALADTADERGDRAQATHTEAADMAAGDGPGVPRPFEARLDEIEARIDGMIRNFAADVRTAMRDPRRR